MLAIVQLRQNCNASPCEGFVVQDPGISTSIVIMHQRASALSDHPAFWPPSRWDRDIVWESWWRARKRRIVQSSNGCLHGCHGVQGRLEDADRGWALYPKMWQWRFACMKEVVTIPARLQKRKSAPDHKKGATWFLHGKRGWSVAAAV